MKKRHAGMMVVFLLIFLMIGMVMALAADESFTVSSGEIHDDDLLAGGYSVTNDGTVKGDLLAAAQTLTVRGAVEGDIIALASDVNCSGEVGGSLRLAGGNISISSRVARNLMLIGSNCMLGKDSVVKKNVYMLGDTIKSMGTVEGKSLVYGSDVTLGGVYNGDVNVHITDKDGRLSLLPGTVINGKLTYKGETEFYLPSDVQVQSYEFVKASPPDSVGVLRLDVMATIKKLATLTVYFLFALLLFRLFPKFFVRSGNYISQSPLAAAGVGLAALGTFVGGLLLLLILFLLLIAIMDFSVFGFTGLVFVCFGLFTLVFADIPVSLWLGDKLARKTGSVPAKLAAGFVVIQTAKLAFKLLSSLSSVGSIFGAFGFLINAAVWLLGTGAVLKTLFSMLKAANQQAEAEDLGIAE